MAFGLSFGTNKSKSKETANKTETGTQSQTGTNTSTTSGTQSTTGTNSSTNTGTQTSGTNQATTGTQVVTGGTTGFGAGVLDSIADGASQFINKILSSKADGGTAMGALGDFDPEQFIESTMRAARSSGETKLGETIRGIVGLVGGNTNENSAAALLQNKMANETAANLAGVQAQATQTAQGIMNQRAGTIAGIGTSETNALAQFLNSIKGGESQTTQQTANTEASTGGTTTNTVESGTQTTDQTVKTAQTVEEIINQLIASTNQSSGTVVGTNTKKGGGVSLGL